MEFWKKYTCEKKDKKSRIFILAITFASKVECVFFKRKTSFLTVLIFAKKNSTCFEPNGMFNSNEISNEIKKKIQ